MLEYGLNSYYTTYFVITVSLFPFAIQPIANLNLSFEGAITGSLLVITLIMLLYLFVIAGAFLRG
jgi:hypothetical protein